MIYSPDLRRFVSWRYFDDFDNAPAVTDWLADIDDCWHDRISLKVMKPTPGYYSGSRLFSCGTIRLDVSD